MAGFHALGITAWDSRKAQFIQLSEHSHSLTVSEKTLNRDRQILAANQSSQENWGDTNLQNRYLIFFPSLNDDFQV